MTLANSHYEFMAEVRRWTQIFSGIGSPPTADDNATTDSDIKERDANLRESLRVLGIEWMALEKGIQAQETAGNLTDQDREELAHLQILMQDLVDHAIKVLGSLKNAN
jgi:hypothetical protein